MEKKASITAYVKTALEKVGFPLKIPQTKEGQQGADPCPAINVFRA